MAQAKNGDSVKVHYTGKFEDGTVFDTSAERDPLQFTIGEGQVVPGFEKAAVGMSPGETKTAKIPADEAYGPHRQEMIMVVDRSQLPPEFEPVVEQRVQIRQADNQTCIATITEVTESAVTLDANHPLAGKDLIFDIQLVGID